MGLYIRSDQQLLDVVKDSMRLVALPWAQLMDAMICLKPRCQILAWMPVQSVMVPMLTLPRLKLVGLNMMGPS